MNILRPPFTLETATDKVRTAEDAWNSRDREEYRWLILKIPNGETVIDSLAAGTRYKNSSLSSGNANSTIDLSSRCGVSLIIASQFDFSMSITMLMVSGSGLTEMNFGSLVAMD